jgi:hypothetical protein
MLPLWACTVTRTDPHDRRADLARRIIDALDTFKPNLGRNLFIERAIKEAATILEKIDER